MKRLLSTLPLLLGGAALAFLTACLAFGSGLITPDTLGLGAGLVTCAGLCAMSGADGRRGRQPY